MELLYYYNSDEKKQKQIKRIKERAKRLNLSYFIEDKGKYLIATFLEQISLFKGS